MIRVENVSKVFGGQRVLDDLSFELASGAHLVVTGPSGSGKTTLLRILAGLEEPGGGRVWLDGNVASEPGYALPPHERSMGFAFQAAALWPHMTVARHIRFALRDGAGARARFELLAAGLGVESLLDKYPHQLSGGESRRVSIARAMAASPARLILDEPLSHLDSVSKHSVLAFVLAQAREIGASVILVTHDDREAAEVPGATLRLAKRSAGP